MNNWKPAKEIKHTGITYKISTKQWMTDKKWSYKINYASVEIINGGYSSQSDAIKAAESKIKEIEAACKQNIF